MLIRHQRTHRGRGRRGIFFLGLGQNGVSILELLLAVLIGSLVISAAMEIFVTANHQSIWQDEVTEVQNSARAVQRLLSQHLRMAGFGIPGTLSPITGTNANPDTITITHQAASGCEAFMTVAAGNVTDELVCGVSDLSCFSQGLWVYIYDAAADSGEFFQIADIYVAPAALVPVAPLGRLYPSGAGIYNVEQVTYFIDQSDPDHPRLMERPYGAQARPYAEDIEELHFSYVMSNGDTVLTPAQPRLISNVLVNLVARTSKTDEDVQQDYRRRELTFNVSIRNQEF